MLLRKLDIHGFKSFAEKTTIELDAGITAIVGPNGSGKSNISDAIRWALGEQSLRTLRGSKTEDIIFGGTDQRKPLGVAEVTLVFDNSDHLLSLDYDQVAITRRIFRSGDGEYYINKKPCRLKDIHQLLADTGLGKDSMAVIGQNKVDEVLNNKPEERRALFEEAAGIAKFKQRKREALRKLEETEGNLNRVNDLMTEIEDQLEPLAEKADQLRQYQRWQEELLACKSGLLLEKLRRIQNIRNLSREKESSLTDSQIALQAQLAGQEVQAEEMQNALTDQEQAVAGAEERVSKQQEELHRQEGELAVLEERGLQAGRTLTRLQEEVIRLNERENRLQKMQLQTGEDLIARKQERQQSHETVQRAEEFNRRLQQELQTLQEQVATGKDRSFSNLQELTQLRNQIHVLERECERLRGRRSSLESEQKRYQAEYAQLQVRLTASRQKERELEADLQQQKLHGTAIQAELSQLEQNQTRELAELEECRRRLQSGQARGQILKQLQQDYEGFNRGIRLLLTDGGFAKEAICGAVAELFHVPEKYMLAVETALGGAMQHVVTRDEQAAREAMTFLKERQAGRATFLPLTTLRPSRRRAAEEQVAQMEGFVGFASQLTDCEPVHGIVKEFLLGRVIVARDMDAALRMAQSQDFSLRLVTLDGQQIHPGGSMTGGSVRRRESSFWGRRRELEEVLAATKQAEEELQKRLTCQQDSIRLLQENRQKAKELEQRCHEREVAHTAWQGEYRNLSEQNGRLQLSLETVAKELDTNRQEELNYQENLQTLQMQMAEKNQTDQQQKEEVQEIQARLAVCQVEQEQAQEALTQARIVLAGIEEWLQNQKRQAENLTQEWQELQARKQEQNTAVADTQAEIQIAKQQQQDLAAQNEKDTLQLEQLQAARAAQMDARLQIQARVKELEKAVKDSRRKQGEVQRQLHEVQLTNTKYDFEWEHAQEELYNLGLDEEQARQRQREAPLAELQEMVQTCEAAMNALGPINPAAIEDYEHTRQRHQFLADQRQDLITAWDSLKNLIREMDENMARQFKQAFDVINRKFADIFVRLFGGGKASLELTLPEQLLESGIDILVQPPGKKMQNLALLSGGERALTVIALLFSFLAYRPAPFCVVDEIDAALDEANVSRFSAFLKDYATHTQFIVVTHRRGTMEAADCMQGVTMEDRGISKMISVKFDQQTLAAEQ